MEGSLWRGDQEGGHFRAGKVAERSAPDSDEIDVWNGETEGGGGAERAYMSHVERIRYVGRVQVVECFECDEK